jgi:hypothetical protein
MAFKHSRLFSPRRGSLLSMFSLSAAATRPASIDAADPIVLRNLLAFADFHPYKGKGTPIIK